MTSFEDFMHNVEYFVDVTADYRSDFVVFPELFTLQLLSVHNEPLSPANAARLVANVNVVIDGADTERIDWRMVHWCTVPYTDERRERIGQLLGQPLEPARYQELLTVSDHIEPVAETC